MAYTYTRRQWLTLAAAATVTALPPAKAVGAAAAGPSLAASPPVDVVVLGAGLSGLTAARALMKAGKSVQVLEARDRVGGRAWTTSSQGKHFDLGGQFLGPSQTRALALYAEAGVRLTPAYLDGHTTLELSTKMVRYPGETPSGLPIFDLLAYAGVSSKIEAIAKSVGSVAPWDHPQSLAYDSISLADYIGQQSRSKMVAEIFSVATRSLLGVEPSEMSLLFFAYYCAQGDSLANLLAARGGAQDKWLVDGAQTLPLKMAEQLADGVIKQAQVLRIEQTDSVVRITTIRGVVEARRAILAMPPAAASSIIFEPWLPRARNELQQHSPMGAYAKIVVVYDKPFWRAKKLNGYAASSIGPMASTFDESALDGSYGAMLGFIGGDPKRAWATLDQAGRKAAVIAQMVRLYGPEAATPADYLEKDWADEPWSRGAPTAAFSMGTLARNGPALRTPIGRLHMAGTEAAEHWSGYLDGAIRAGEAAAAAVRVKLE